MISNFTQGHNLQLARSHVTETSQPPPEVQLALATLLLIFFGRPIQARILSAWQDLSSFRDSLGELQHALPYR